MLTRALPAEVQSGSFFNEIYTHLATVLKEVLEENNPTYPLMDGISGSV
jgi:hypothetical protein